MIDLDNNDEGKEKDEEEELVEDLKQELALIFKRVLDSYGADESFYELEASLTIRNSNFEKYKEIKLMEPSKSFCAFCGKPTEFYDDDLQSSICAACYSKIHIRRTDA